MNYSASCKIFHSFPKVIIEPKRFLNCINYKQIWHKRFILCKDISLCVHNNIIHDCQCKLNIKFGTLIHTSTCVYDFYYTAGKWFKVVIQVTPDMQCTMVLGEAYMYVFYMHFLLNVLFENTKKCISDV